MQLIICHNNGLLSKIKVITTCYNAPIFRPRIYIQRKEMKTYGPKQNNFPDMFSKHFRVVSKSDTRSRPVQMYNRLTPNIISQFNCLDIDFIDGRLSDSKSRGAFEKPSHKRSATPLTQFHQQSIRCSSGFFLRLEGFGSQKN